MMEFRGAPKLSAALTTCCAFAAVCCASQAGTTGGESKRTPALEIFFLPKDYRGPFIAVYGQRGGVVPRWTGDTAVYLVPKDGILKISLEEPPRSTKVSHVFADKPKVTLRNIPTCADMRVRVADSIPSICWLDYSVGGTGIPNHVVAVVTDWIGIPTNFNRTTFVYDSVLFNGSGKATQKWEEPPELRRRQRIGYRPSGS